MFELGTEEYLRHGIKMTPHQKINYDYYYNEFGGKCKNKKKKSKRKSNRRSLKKEGMSYSNYRNKILINETTSISQDVAALMGGAAKLLGGTFGLALASYLGWKGYKAFRDHNRKLANQRQKQFESTFPRKVADMADLIANFVSAEHEIQQQDRIMAAEKLAIETGQFHIVKQAQVLGTRIDALVVGSFDDFLQKKGEEALQEMQKEGSQEQGTAQQDTQQGTAQQSTQQTTSPKPTTTKENMSYVDYYNLIIEQEQQQQEGDEDLKKKVAEILAKTPFEKDEFKNFFTAEYMNGEQFKKDAAAIAEAFPSIREINIDIEPKKSEGERGEPEEEKKTQNESSYIDSIILQKLHETRRLFSSDSSILILEKQLSDDKIREYGEYAKELSKDEIEFLVKVKSQWGRNNFLKAAKEKKLKEFFKDIKKKLSKKEDEEVENEEGGGDEQEGDGLPQTTDSPDPRDEDKKFGDLDIEAMGAFSIGDIKNDKKVSNKVKKALKEYGVKGLDPQKDPELAAEIIATLRDNKPKSKKEFEAYREEARQFLHKEYPPTKSTVDNLKKHLEQNKKYKEQEAKGKEEKEVKVDQHGNPSDIQITDNDSAEENKVVEPTPPSPKEVKKVETEIQNTQKEVENQTSLMTSFDGIKKLAAARIDNIEWPSEAMLNKATGEAIAENLKKSNATFAKQVIVKNIKGMQGASVDAYMKRDEFDMPEDETKAIFGVLYGSDGAAGEYAEDFKRFQSCMTGQKCILVPTSAVSKKSKNDELKKDLENQLHGIFDDLKKVDASNATEKEKAEKTRSLLSRQKSLEEALKKLAEEDKKSVVDMLSSVVSGEDIGEWKSNITQNLAMSFVEKIIPGGKEIAKAMRAPVSSN